jgi:hypothetical protein
VATAAASTRVATSSLARMFDVLPGLVNLLAFLVARSAPEVSLLIYAGLPVLYFVRSPSCAAPGVRRLHLSRSATPPNVRP